MTVQYWQLPLQTVTSSLYYNLGKVFNIIFIAIIYVSFIHDFVQFVYSFGSNRKRHSDTLLIMLGKYNESLNNILVCLLRRELVTTIQRDNQSSPYQLITINFIYIYMYVYLSKCAVSCKRRSKIMSNSGTRIIRVQNLV